MPLSENVKALMEELEKESFGEVPEGIQHLVVNMSEEPVTFNEDGLPRLRVSYRVFCGQFEEVSVSDFIGFYGNPRADSKKSLEQRNKSARAMDLGRLAAIANATGSDPAAELVLELKGLDTVGEDATHEVGRIMAEFGEAVDTLPLWARITKDPSGRARVAYLAEDSDDATCECDIETISF